ncbi:MAG: TIM barrel protein [Anaerolineaceae bacterium]|nr:TIM barrel protein [Anaerolineaceae bacterium]
MRLGVTGMMPGNLDDVDERLARKIAELGFTGVGAHLAGEPQKVSAETCHRAKSILEQQGIRIIQFWGWYDSIITSDEPVRQSGVSTAQEIIRLASLLGADMVGIRPTSLNPRGAWWPHPENDSPATEERLVRSLREITSVCETYGVPIALECHVTSTLNSATAVRRIIEATGSKWIKVNMDPINFIPDLRTAHHTTDLLNELFDVLGSYVAAAHIKDVYVEDRHVVHISETIPGDGIFDFDTFFRRFEETLPEGYGFIEHLPESQIPRANVFVREKLKQLNIPILN